MKTKKQEKFRKIGTGQGGYTDKELAKAKQERDDLVGKVKKVMGTRKFNLEIEFPVGSEKQKDGSTIFIIQTSVRERHRIISEIARMINIRREEDKENWKDKKLWQKHSKEYSATQEARDMVENWMMLKLAEECGLDAAHEITIRFKK